MTDHTIEHEPAGGFRALAGRIRNSQKQVSDRAHSAADQHARAQGWTVTESTGRFGMGARVYRDPRFGARPLRQPRYATTSGRGTGDER